jgi:lysophospholipase L1-like esterase
MTKPLALLALSLLLGTHAIAQSSFFGVKINPGAPPKTVLVFGDSISESTSLPKDKQDQNWVRLIDTESGGWLTAINESKRDRTTSALTDFEAAVNKKRDAKPDLIAIMLGTQDSRDPSAQCVPRAVNNLRALITAARKKLGPQFPILIIAPPNLRQRDLPLSLAKPEQREACLQSMATAYAGLAAETKCAFASTYGAVPEEHFLKGGLLPDESGHLALAKALLPAVAKAAGFKETVK